MDAPENCWCDDHSQDFCNHECRDIEWNGRLRDVARQLREAMDSTSVDLADAACEAYDELMKEKDA